VRYPSIGQAILLVIVAVVLQVATGATVFALAYAKLGDDTAAAEVLKDVWVLAPVILISNGLALALGLRATRERVRQFFRVRAFDLRLLPAVILTSAGLAIVLSEIDNCFVQLILLVTGTAKPPADLIDLSISPLGGAILIILIAPLLEEYLFRGLILRGLLTRSDTVAAVVVSALAFGVAHASVRQGFLAVIIGLALGWWYARTRSVGPGIVGHVAFNSIAWGAAQVPGLSGVLGLHNGNGVDSLVHSPWWFTLAGLVFAAIGISSFHRNARVIGTDPSPPPLPLAEPPLLSEPPLLGPP
jgi:membrane protease YdiL (CAAX protease family)